MIVTVRASNGSAVCDATVELLDSKGQSAATVAPSLDMDCSYTASVSGVFGVRARKGAAVSETKMIDVALGECSSIIRKAEVALTLMP